MKKLILLLVFPFLCFSCLSVRVDSEKNNTVISDDSSIVKQKSKTKHDISMYPSAKDGYQRFIIDFSTLKKEDNYKVEVYVGKTMSIDCNYHSLTGQFTEMVIDGWGYPYLKFTTNGETMSTLKGCLDDDKREVFVSGQRKLVDYNSQLPIVVYAPKGYEVRYNIWEKGQQTYSVN